MLTQQSITDLQRHVDDHVYEYTRGVVLTGPFQGMHLTREISWPDTKLSPMLLGCYESELHEPLEKIIDALANKQDAVVVNVGSAEGFYAVGLAHRLPSARVYALEGHEPSVVIAKEAAARNGVELVFGADVNEVFRSPDLIVMDCEGAEVDYLDPVRFPALKDATIIVEVHVLPVTENRPEGQRTDQILVENFRDTHKIVALFEGPRNPNQFRCLHDMNSLERWLAVSEGRPCLMCWFVMVPRDKQ